MLLLDSFFFNMPNYWENRLVQVACPLITRRLLGVPDPLCCSSSGRFNGGIAGSFIADLFQWKRRNKRQLIPSNSLPIVRDVFCSVLCAPSSWTDYIFILYFLTTTVEVLLKIRSCFNSFDYFFVLVIEKSKLLLVAKLEIPLWTMVTYPGGKYTKERVVYWRSYSHVCWFTGINPC